MSSPSSKVHGVLQQHENRLLEILNVPIISNGRVNPVFKRDVLSSGKSPNLNLKECINALSMFLGDISDPSSFSTHLPNLKKILEQLLCSVMIFDPEVQGNVRPLLGFLQHFEKINGKTDETIASILKDYRAIISFSENHQRERQKIFSKAYKPRVSSIIQEANGNQSIQVYLRSTIADYLENVKRSESSNIHESYVRAQLILELIGLQSLTCKENGRLVLSGQAALNRTNEAITFLLQDRQKFQKYTQLENKGESLSRPANAISKPQAQKGEERPKEKEKAKEKPEDQVPKDGAENGAEGKAKLNPDDEGENALTDLGGVQGSAGEGQGNEGEEDNIEPMEVIVGDDEHDDAEPASPLTDQGGQGDNIVIVNDDKHDDDAESESSFSSSFIFMVAATVGIGITLLALAVGIGFLTAGVAPTLAFITGVGLLAIGHPVITVGTLATGIGVPSMISYVIKHSFFGKNAVENNPSPGASAVVPTSTSKEVDDKVSDEVSAAGLFHGLTKMF